MTPDDAATKGSRLGMHVEVKGTERVEGMFALIQLGTSIPSHIGHWKIKELEINGRTTTKSITVKELMDRAENVARKALMDWLEPRVKRGYAAMPYEEKMRVTKELRRIIAEANAAGANISPL